MALHDFKCEHCKLVFEGVLRADDIIPGEVPNHPCPTCHDPAFRIFLTAPGVHGVEGSMSTVVWYENDKGQIGTPMYTDLSDPTVRKRHEWYNKNGYKRKEVVREKQVHQLESRLSDQNGKPFEYKGRD